MQLGPEQTICYITGVGPKNLGPTQNLHYSPNEIWSKTKPFFWLVQLVFEYHRRAIISRGLYIFYSIFEDHFFVFKEDFPENSSLMYGYWLIFKSGLYLRAGYDGPHSVYQNWSKFCFWTCSASVQKWFHIMRWYSSKFKWVNMYLKSAYLYSRLSLC